MVLREGISGRSKGKWIQSPLCRAPFQHFHASAHIISELNRSDAVGFDAVAAETQFVPVISLVDSDAVPLSGGDPLNHPSGSSVVARSWDNSFGVFRIPCVRAAW